MVRATSRAPSVGLPPTAASRIRSRRKKPYKVQLEQVMTRKKKLKLHDIHGSAKPRPGYTFLPVGYADLAERCKEQSRQLGVDVAVVSAGSRKGATDPQKLTHHVHRVGYHFRSDIFDKACNFLGYREINGKLVRETGLSTQSRFEQTVARYGPRFDLIDMNNHSAEESTKVKKYIRELFPKIPEDDLHEIYKRAWEQGATTVGNASDLSLSRQVQLATIARIRHTYTDYDRLLREVTWREARQTVEQACLAKLIEWRGENDHEPEELEEILRETIVIDDDDDEDEDEDEDDVDSNVDSDNVDEDSDTSIEIVQHTIAPKDLRVDAGEKPKLQRRVMAPAGQAMDRVLPVSLQTRWHDARMRHRAADRLPSSNPHGRASHISVPLDQQGKAPRKVISGGVEYIRLSPDPPPAGTTPIPGPGHPLPAPHINPSMGRPHDEPLIRGNGMYQWSPYQRAPLPTVARRVEATPVIDLTSPPRPQIGHRNVAPYPYPEIQARPYVHQPNGHWDAHTSRPDYHHTISAPVNPVPQTRSYQPNNSGAFQHNRLPATIEHLDLTKPEDRPIQSREVHIPSQPYPPHVDVGKRETDGRLAGGHQPIYGQPAYPQMRSRTIVPRATPRPVHGAPAAVQALSPRDRAPSIGQAGAGFGAPSPQRHFLSTNRPYYIPDR